MQVEIIRESFRIINEREPGFAARFYERLFATYPRLKPLFGRNSPNEQHRMLYQALVAILDHLDDAFWLKGALEKYGERHAAYGVTEEMYEQFGQCLMETLAELRGPDWTPSLAAAWAEAYDAVCAHMKAGGRGAQPPGAA